MERGYEDVNGVCSDQFFDVVECSIFYAFYPDLLALFMFPSILSLEDFLLRMFPSTCFIIAILGNCYPTKTLFYTYRHSPGLLFMSTVD